jgi:hypothetical protein
MPGVHNSAQATAANAARTPAKSTTPTKPVHHIVFPLNQPDIRRFYPVFVNTDEARNEKEAIEFARGKWKVGKDEKVEVQVQIFRD